MKMKRFYVANKVIRELQLSSKAINVYDYLCMCVDRNNECFPNKRTIAVNCSISVASVTRALRELEKVKMISTVARFEYVKCEKSYIRQTSNIYHIYETPQIENDDTLSTEPKDEPKVELEELPEKVEICACEALQDENTADILDSDNAVETECSFAPSVQPSSEAIQELQDTIVTANTDRTIKEPTEKSNLVTCFLISSIMLVKTLFSRASHSDFDTPPHVTVTRQGTRTKLKVTVNFRRNNIFSKLTKRYKLHKYTNLAG